MSEFQDYHDKLINEYLDPCIPILSKIDGEAYNCMECCEKECEHWGEYNNFTADDYILDSLNCL